MNQFDSVPGQSRGISKSELESMGFGHLKSHPVAGPILEEMAKKYLLNEDPDKLIFKKDGFMGSLPSTFVVDLTGRNRVTEMTKNELRNYLVKKPV